MNVKGHKRKCASGKVTKVRDHSKADKVSSKRGHKVFSGKQRDKMAMSGEALPDGSFPISSERDLANAITSVGRSSNPEVAKRHIIKRAKAIGKTELLPEKWRK